MSAGLLINVVVIALLGATCLYCARLSRRLDEVKSGQTALKEAIDEFDAAARRAEATLARIEETGLESARNLTRTKDRASALATDLSVMVAAGERIAARIEAAVGDVRAVAGRARKARAQ
ncbi:MAG: DUF6468 domain-containing protein [Parvularculaceae bacterium]